LDWTDFAQRLTRELMHLPVDAFVIVQGPGGLPYVQAMRYLNGLHAEAVSSDYLPEPLDSAQELRLSELGWQAPDGRARRNWWCRVMLPADVAAVTPEQAAECGALADRMVAAFRDVYGMPSVAGLTYEANRNGEDAGPVPMPGLGIPAADAEPPAAGPDLNWAEFTERLARELAAMEPEMVLVVPHRDQESHYVQAFRDARRIRAEAVSGQALPPSAPRFDAREEERLAAAGWWRPGEHPNWTFELPAGAAPEEYRRLAAMMVTALRDVQLARSPADLVYEAFIGAAYVELTEFGIPSADPGRVDARRASRPLPDAGPAPEPSVPERHAAAPVAAHALTPSGPSADPDIEEELTAAKSRGDQPGYLGLVLRADLFVPVTEGEQPVTATFRDGTYVLAYTSPEAMDWALGGKLMDYRRTTFIELARNWPRPDWQLAINSRLPSSAYIDTGTIQRTAERAGGRRPAPSRPSTAPSAEPLWSNVRRTPVAETARPPAPGPAAPPGDERVAGTAAPHGTAPAEATGHPADKPVAGRAAAYEGVLAGAMAPPTGEPTAKTATAPEDTPAETTPPPTDEPAGGTTPHEDASSQAPASPADEPAGGTTAPREDALTQTPASSTDKPAGRAAAAYEDPLTPATNPPADKPASGTTASRGDALTGAIPSSSDEPAGRAAAAYEDPLTQATDPYTDGPVAGAATARGAASGEAVDPPVVGSAHGDTSIGAMTSSAEEPASGAAAPREDALTRAVDPSADEPVAGAATAYRSVPGEAGTVHEDVFGGTMAPVAGAADAFAPLAEPAGARTEAAPTAGPLEEGVVMQKVIRPDHVVHYLDGGYDWVAGRIHRLQDVSDLQTPEQLVSALGLGYEGSPFSPDDAEVYVIRWPVLKPALVRAEPTPAGSAFPAFRIGSQRLPHGAEMFGIDHRGTETFLAVYDADIRGWIRTEAAG
jgi:hypothetical protein